MAFVAVIPHVEPAAPDAVNVDVKPETAITQLAVPSVVTAKDTSPAPEPPVAARTTEPPKTCELDEVMERADCDDLLSTSDWDTDVREPDEYVKV